MHCSSFVTSASKAQLRMEQLDQVIRGLVGLSGSVSAGKGAGRSRIMSASARRRISLAQKARWAKVSGERGFNWIEAGQAHHISSRQKENRSRTAGTVGEGEGGEEGCITPATKSTEKCPCNDSDAYQPTVRLKSDGRCYHRDHK